MMIKIKTCACRWFLVMTLCVFALQAMAQNSSSTNEVVATHQEAYGAWFGMIFDARQALPDTDKARAYLQKIRPNIKGKFSDEVKKALADAQETPNKTNIDHLSAVLYQAQKSAMPTDDVATTRAQFGKKMYQAQRLLQGAIDDFARQRDGDRLKNAYDDFNQAWGKNEKAVRQYDARRYGKIELAMALLRVQIYGDSDVAKMNAQSGKLYTLIDDFVHARALDDGDKKTQAGVADGLDLLQKVRQSLASNDTKTAQSQMTQFLQQWGDFELVVQQQDMSLYSDIERDLPLVLAGGDGSLALLDSLILRLQNLDGAVHYHAIDAMLILLREGVEALLIVMALLMAMDKVKQKKAKAWVMIGAFFGLLASAWVAYGIIAWFPKAQNARELAEGVVGIVAVVVMLGMGAWLHSKSSMRAWNGFIQKNTARALHTGSFLTLALASFLAVFREGAETVLFYVSIFPNIAARDLAWGIILAVILLCLFAYVLQKFSQKIALSKLFAYLGFLIYVLGFKILGSSVHTLQLMGKMSHTTLALPSIDWLGFYASAETLVAQVIYIALALYLYYRHRHAV